MRKTRPIAPIMLALAACAWCAGLRAEDSPEAIKNARKRFAEGVAAMDGKKYEEARVAFAQAYALKPHASVLRNLGQAELRTGHYVEAARHLSSFLRDTSFGTAEERDLANKALEEAEAKVGKIAVEVDVGGAEITLDGDVAPAGEPVYGEPGRRTLRVKKAGYADYESVEALEAGRSLSLKVTMQRVGSGAATPTAAPPTTATPSSASPISGAQQTMSPERPAQPRSTSRVEPAIVVVGATVAVVGLATGVGFAMQAGSKASARDDRLAGLTGPSPCGERTPDVGACAEIARLADDRAAAQNRATASFIVGGVAAAATLAYVLWPRSASRSVQLVPTLTYRHAGMFVTTSF
jgi:hypothetical protein